MCIIQVCGFVIGKGSQRNQRSIRCRRRCQAEAGTEAVVGVAQDKGTGTQKFAKYNCYTRHWHP